MARAHYEEWICYVRMPKLSDPEILQEMRYYDEFAMFRDIESYARMRIEAELGAKGVDFNIAKVEKVTE